MELYPLPKATNNLNSNNMKKLLLSLVALMCALSASAEYYEITTKNTTLLLSTEKGRRVEFIYYGPKVNKVDEVFNTSSNIFWNAYPCFGTNCTCEHALAVTHANGDVSLELATYEVKKYTDPDGGRVWEFLLKDKVFPFYVKQFFKAYDDCDIIKTWTELSHTEKKDVMLNKFASAYIPVKSGDIYLNYLAGGWGAEAQLFEERLLPGRKTIGNHDGARTSFGGNPSFMVSLDGPAKENAGNVLGGTLSYTGNYDLSFVKNGNANHLEIVAGINPELSQYYLEPKEVFTTPEFIFTYSTEGKGGVSRNLHRWARNYHIIGGTEPRDILLNSWEGVYFNVNQEGMNQMMQGFAEIGGELFVMDDGWFGDKYPRDNGESSLGDWVVCEKKLPEGIGALIDEAERNNLKFGIWIEPEMCNTKSELYEKHPDWVLRQPDREPSKGRGGTQLVLDMCNPKVQDHVFNVVDNLMQTNPRIYYMKWDANMSISNASSLYLPKDRQSHLYIEYHRGLMDVCKRIREKYPKLVIQLCASGGGRLNYGYFPYFNECWSSDNTDAVQRLYIQHGMSHFYPANIMAAHVSASPNHQTGRVVPIKFRFDVAMTGRLGMEMKPSALSQKEREFAKRAIETYKSIRPVIQQGDLYRLVSPYEKKPYVSLMYNTPEKDRAVFFLFRRHYINDEWEEPRKMAGLDPDRNYMIRELNAENPNKKLSIEGKVVSGRFLMENGIRLNLGKDLSSVVLELVAQ